MEWGRKKKSNKKKKLQVRKKIKKGKNMKLKLILRGQKDDDDFGILVQEMNYI